MRPVSEAFLEAITKPHVAVTKAVLTDANGDNTALEPIDGSVSLDATAQIRGTCELTLSDDGTKDLVPMAATDPLTPFGSQVRLKRGVRFIDGTEEYASLGVFVIESVDVEDAGDSLEIRIDGQDQAGKVARAAFEEPYQVAQGTLFTTAIRKLVEDVLGEVATNFADAADTATPSGFSWQEGQDRWSVAQDLSLGLACDLYFDGDGVLTLTPALDNEVVFDLTEGEDGVLIQAGRNWTRDGIVNRWIVSGENSGEVTVRGQATDFLATSPTRYSGPFGPVPRFESYSWVVTAERAEDVAQMLKAKQMGLSQAVSFGSVVNPALEPGDVVQINRPRAGISEAHRIEQLTIPLSHEQPMSGTTRAQVVNL